MGSRGPSKLIGRAGQGTRRGQTGRAPGNLLPPPPLSRVPTPGIYPPQQGQGCGSFLWLAPSQNAFSSMRRPPMMKYESSSKKNPPRPFHFSLPFKPGPAAYRSVLVQKKSRGPSGRFCYKAKGAPRRSNRHRNTSGAG